MESLKQIKTLPLIIIAIMCIFSFANLLGLNISGFVIPLGVIFFFINKAIEKESASESRLDIKSIKTNFMDKKIWFWIAMPLVIDTICIVLSLLFLPQYIEFETNRASSFVPVELSISSAFLFFVFALGEEIAWRAFFQNQLTKIYPFIPVLMVSSLLFSLGHYTSGNNSLALYGLLFTFINSCLYGVIFEKSKNAWVSAIAHFVANMYEVFLIVLITA